MLDRSTAKPLTEDTAHIMTGPSWCPACEEECPDQPDGICTTCGDELQPSPTSAQHTNNNAENNSTAAAGQSHDPVTMALLQSSIQNTGLDGSTLMPLLNQLRSGNNTNAQGADISDIASILPPEALNPQAGGSRHRPVSKRILDDMKRVVLTEQSAELFDAQVELFGPREINNMSPCLADNKSLKLNAVPGEFGPRISDKNRKAALVVCSPRTTKGGLSSNTLEEIASLSQHRMPFIAYVERGDGITFVQKAIACQRAGENEKGQSLCAGVIVGNAGTAKEVWPYAMQDTKDEATNCGLNVPVVMIRREDGKKLVQMALQRNDADGSQYIPCHIHIHSKEEHSCPVCAECYVSGATIVRLPTCGHVFHESCAMMWLTKHNTCPYCRKELPTEDEEYEIERRRREARESSDVAENGVNGSSFYG